MKVAFYLPEPAPLSVFCPDVAFAGVEIRAGCSILCPPPLVGIGEIAACETKSKCKSRVVFSFWNSENVTFEATKKTM